jgi:hypothetical protein
MKFLPIFINQLRKTSVGTIYVQIKTAVKAIDRAQPVKVASPQCVTDLSRTTKEKIAYHNGKEYFRLGRAGSAQPARKAN